MCNKHRHYMEQYINYKAIEQQQEYQQYYQQLHTAHYGVARHIYNYAKTLKWCSVSN